ncbi:MAG: phosphatase PAP2 family protein [Cellvibrio sp.]|uniref:phosphatase PAP2 family protein n=1 Tax=Cellvibrio sp. TaxID=1965322 RepID=UPI0027198766|nr:phosphatase PAP2 family protein [Cellvibrio sp.]
MKLSLVVASVLIMLGAIFAIIPAANRIVFIEINSFFPNKNLWLAITTLGDGAVAGCVFYLLFRKSSDLLTKGLIGGVIAIIASQGLKSVFGILRPEHTAGFENNIQLLTESMQVTNFSMPSGHTITAFLLGALLFQYLKLNVMGKVFLAIVMITIATSRIALGVHWPADVLVGAGVGMFIAVGCAILTISIKNKWGTLAVHISYLPFVAALIHKYFL